jgi:hypothetical protein
MTEESECMSLLDPLPFAFRDANISIVPDGPTDPLTVGVLPS